ncbi:MAG: dihydroorotase [Chloroflexota bacterium]
MPDIVIRGGRVVDPASGLDSVLDVLLREGRIAAVDDRISIPSIDSVVIDAAGQVVCPGFVDLHTHLRFPGFPEKETVASGTDAASAGGFTTICAMANTNPVVDSVETLTQVMHGVRDEARVRVRQLGSVTRGLRGASLTDMPALAGAGVVAFSDDGMPLMDADVMRSALQSASLLRLPISVHEEDVGVVRRGVANAGAYAKRHGLAEWPCTGEASLVARDLKLLDEVGGHLHIAHVSCAETVDLLRRAKERGLAVTAEATPHHLRLTERWLDGDVALSLPAAHPCTKVNPPLRSLYDVAALVDALADGTIDAVATDHAPHTRADKEKPYASAAFGLSALETALPLVLDLVRDGRLGLMTLLARLTSGPARVFNLQAGSLTPGAPGDVCVFDPDARWTLDEDALRSRGKNTPLMGSDLQGRVTHTIVGGEVVYRRAT